MKGVDRTVRLYTAFFLFLNIFLFKSSVLLLKSAIPLKGHFTVFKVLV